ncbi:MAG: ATP-binding cassette domain-containing protein [Bradyrhizobium sp.]|uniref:ATP-binding cassette domain-containing protein n=1 Tax=Bradyrhizobium sp. TaxID=376 RepID=UPI0011F6E957|nr:ATP-binding cassette domain-containing protein [Bradyrhizobium sp.]THD70372.1 MAG: ATP-binding cassette domain-containing protein [Bradyrhizobium sp.]
MTPLKPTGPQAFCGKSHILQDMGLTVNERKFVTLLGRNGAGKTTTLHSILGLTLPREASAANETVQAAYLGNAA